MTILQRSVKLLQKDPYQTSWEISLELGVRVSTVSSVLLRDTLRPFGMIGRRTSQVSRRGWEYFVKEINNAD